MKSYFDEDARPSTRGKGDTELTLGSGMLLGVFFGLVVLCGLCFGFGYAVGSRSSKGPVFQSQPPAAGPAPQLPLNSPQGKPSAGAQPPAPLVPSTAGSDQAAVAASETVPAAAPGVAATITAPPGTAPSPTAQPVAAPGNASWHAVEPAMPGGYGNTPNGQPIPATAVQSAMPAQGSLMVQIAALSNQQDADVLIGALRRRGYAVSAVRNPADNLIHVCIGPFGNQMDANSMRQKLLSDGYNAVVLP